VTLGVTSRCVCGCGGRGKLGLSTIRKYVEAIGGKLEIVADFGDERLVLG
jgi:signal transduction histidine kinase